MSNKVKENSKQVKIILKKINNSVNNNKCIRKIVFNVSVILFIFVILNSVYGATDPTLVTKINSALKKIQGYLVKFATPAAGVAIASGVLMRKFSFGNEEKMAIGKKVIVNAIIGYAIILSIDLIIKFVDSLI